MVKLKELVLLHLQAYPSMEATDFYKLIFQSTMGPVHSLASIERAKQWFFQEWSQVSSVQETPFIEDISLQQSLFRVHFASCKKKRISPDRIFGLFIETSRTFSENYAFFETCMNEFAEITKHPTFSHVKNEFLTLWKQVQKEKTGIPSHSEVFRKVYQPHYRIVSGQHIADIVPHSSS